MVGSCECNASARSSLVASLQRVLTNANRIYGGGAITGIFAAQLAALSGVKVLAVASPSNFEYLRDECRVTACIDRFMSPEQIEQQILDVTKGSRISFALDCVGTKTSDICVRAQLKSAGDAPSHFIGLGGNPKMAVPADSNLIVHRISFSTTVRPECYQGKGDFS